MVPILRIVAGQYGGRWIQAPTGSKTRPTSEMVRESLFNIIRNEIPGKTFLDLFSGSGAIGTEALSRGAKMVVFAEWDRDCCALIRKNLMALGVEKERWQVVKVNIMRQLRQSAEKKSNAQWMPEKNAYDIVFADPPYDLDGLCDLPKLISAGAFLTENGIFILEHNRATILPNQVENLVVSREKEYRGTQMTYYCRSGKGVGAVAAESTEESESAEAAELGPDSEQE